jgi:hypothetical protein
VGGTKCRTHTPTAKCGLSDGAGNGYKCHGKHTLIRVLVFSSTKCLCVCVFQIVSGAEAN